MLGSIMPPRVTLRRVEIALFWGGLALTVLGAVMMAVPAARFAPPAIVLGAGLAALGLNVLLGGDFIAGPRVRTYTARGQVVRGRAEIAAGLADVVLGGAPGDRVATVSFGPFGRPRIDVEEGMANVRLAAPKFPPTLARWRADLASNILWDLDARSTLGSLSLDLSELRLERVSARTTLGGLRVVCPVTRGLTELELSSTVGPVEVVIPERVGTAITVATGPFGAVRQKNERLLAPGQRRYVTADYETAASQVEIRITTSAGDVTLA